MADITFCKKFKFECPMEWESLNDIGRKTIRFCEKCQEKVYLAYSHDALYNLGQKGRCAAFGEREKNGVTEHMILGEVSPDFFPDFMFSKKQLYLHKAFKKAAADGSLYE